MKEKAEKSVHKRLKKMWEMNSLKIKSHSDIIRNFEKIRRKHSLPFRTELHRPQHSAKIEFGSHICSKVCHILKHFNSEPVLHGEQ